MKKIIAIDFDNDKFRAVEVAQGHGGLELIRFAVCGLPAAGLSADWLKTVWSREKFSRATVVGIVPNSLIQYKSVLVPTLPEDQVFAAARMELEGAGIDEDSLCYLLHYHQDHEMISAKLALVNNRELEGIRRILSQAGLDVAWFGFRNHGILNFIQFNRKFFGEDGPEAFAAISPRNTEFGVCSGDQLLFCREFEPGSHELAPGDHPMGLQDFCQELRLSMAASRTLGHERLSSRSIWGFGPAELLTELSRPLLEQTGITLEIPLKTSLPGVVTGNQTPELAALIGLGLEGIGWSDIGRLHVLSRTQQTEANRHQRWRMAIHYLIAGLLFTAGIVFGYQAHIEKADKVAAWLTAHSEILNTLDQADRETHRDMSEMKDLQTWITDKNRELEFFRALEETLPENTQITDVTIEDKVVKDLSGTTPAVSLVLNRLKKSSVLKYLQLKGTIQVTEKGESFHLEGPIGKVPAPKENKR